MPAFSLFYCVVKSSEPGFIQLSPRVCSWDLRVCTISSRNQEQNPLWPSVFLMAFPSVRNLSSFYHTEIQSFFVCIPQISTFHFEILSPILRLLFTCSLNFLQYSVILLCTHFLVSMQFFSSASLPVDFFVSSVQITMREDQIDLIDHYCS